MSYTYTSGTTSTTYEPFITGAGQATTNFDPFADFSQPTPMSPNGNTYYYVSRITGRAKGYDGTSTVTMFLGGTSTSAYSIGDCTTSGTSATTGAYVATGGAISTVVREHATYYGGYSTASAGGLYSTRSTGNTGYAVYLNGSVPSLSPSAASSKIYFVVTYDPMPDTAGEITYSSITGTSVYVTVPYTTGAGGYRVQYSSDGGSTWTDTGLSGSGTVSGLTAGTTYTFRHAAYITAAYNLNAAYTGPWVQTSATVATTDPTPAPGFSDGLTSIRVNSTYSSANGNIYCTNTTSISDPIAVSGYTFPSWATFTQSQSGTDRYMHVSGTPTTAGTYRFQATATGPTGLTQTGTGTIIVTEYPAPTVIGGYDTLSDYLPKNTNYSKVIGFNDATSISYSGSLPPGVTAQAGYASETSYYRQFSGTLTTVGVTSGITVTATGPTGLTTQIGPFSVTVTEIPPVWVDNTISSSGRVAVAYGDNLYASGATSYALASGTLPTGLSFSTLTVDGNLQARIAGTPATGTEGTYNVTVSATNAGGTITTGTLTIIVTPAPVSQAYIYNGTAWQLKTLKTYNGTAWAPGVVWKYSGTAWVKLTAD